MFRRGLYLVLTLPLSSADFCEGRETEREGEKKKVPIWLAITPTAAVKRVGTTVVSLLAQQREKKREE